MNDAYEQPPLRARLRMVGAVAACACALGASGLLVPATAHAGSSGGVGAGSEDREEVAGAPHSKYQRLWDRTSRGDRKWARKTAACESGGNPDALGSGGLYRGAFQFMRATWKTSPHSPGGDPIDYPYRTQAVVAIALMHRDGANHWPVCG